MRFASVWPGTLGLAPPWNLFSRPGISPPVMAVSNTIGLWAVGQPLIPIHAFRRWPNVSCSHTWSAKII